MNKLCKLPHKWTISDQIVNMYNDEDWYYKENAVLLVYFICILCVCCTIFVCRLFCNAHTCCFTQICHKLESIEVVKITSQYSFYSRLICICKINKCRTVIVKYILVVNAWLITGCCSNKTIVSMNNLICSFYCFLTII